MSSPIDSLLTRFIPRRPNGTGRRIRTIFTPRVASRLGSLQSSHLTLATPESLEPRQLMAVIPVQSGNFANGTGILTLDITNADTAYVRVLTSSNIQVSNTATFSSANT